MPKLAQNLAMRPDLVKDEFVRKKLKETQSKNKIRTGAELGSYHHTFGLVLKFGEEECDFDSLLEFDPNGIHKAGSVGQVDMFKVKEDHLCVPAEPLAEFQPGKHVIVKTVFKETEAAYKRDWKLLEIAFNDIWKQLESRGKKLPKVVSRTWEMMEQLSGLIKMLLLF